MASETIWHYTGLPTVVIDAIEKGIDHANAYDEELNKGVK